MLRAAAAQLNLSQPALSRQIHALEAELGVPLFDRVRPRALLTSEGEDLLRRSRRLLTDADSLGERARALKSMSDHVTRELREIRKLDPAGERKKSPSGHFHLDPLGPYPGLLVLVLDLDHRALPQIRERSLLILLSQLAPVQPDLGAVGDRGGPLARRARDDDGPAAGVRGLDSADDRDLAGEPWRLADGNVELGRLLPVGRQRAPKEEDVSRISPNFRISSGFSKFSRSAGTNSATNRGSLGGSLEMKAESIVKLFVGGWQVPQVRPLPANVSFRKSSLPLATSSRCGSGFGGNNDWQLATRTRPVTTTATRTTAADVKTILLVASKAPSLGDAPAEPARSSVR